MENSLSSLDWRSVSTLLGIFTFRIQVGLAKLKTSDFARYLHCFTISFGSHCFVKMQPISEFLIHSLYTDRISCT